MADKKTCKRCGGTGWVDSFAYTQYGRHKIGEEPCMDCNPAMRIEEDGTITWLTVRGKSDQERQP